MPRRRPLWSHNVSWKLFHSVKMSIVGCPGFWEREQANQPKSLRAREGKQEGSWSWFVGVTGFVSRCQVNAGIMNGFQSHFVSFMSDASNIFPQISSMSTESTTGPAYECYHYDMKWWTFKISIAVLWSAFTRCVKYLCRQMRKKLLQDSNVNAKHLWRPKE